MTNDRDLTPEEVGQKAAESADRVLEGVRARLGDDVADELHDGIAAWFERWTLPDGSLDMGAGPPTRHNPPEDVVADIDEGTKQIALGPGEDHD